MIKKQIFLEQTMKQLLDYTKKWQKIERKKSEKLFLAQNCLKTETNNEPTFRFSKFLPSKKLTVHKTWKEERVVMLPSFEPRSNFLNCLKNLKNVISFIFDVF